MIKTESISITSLERLVEAAETIYHRIGGLAWWRGQDDDLPLLPKAHRRPNCTQYERSLTARFMNLAPTRRSGCPLSDAIGEWLFLMQHYGLPTRLLDWTLSPLVATFFAIQKEDALDAPGVIYALDPLGMNEIQYPMRIVPNIDDPEVRRVVAPAFIHDIPVSAKHLAIAPAEIDVRMMVQSSMFTIHGEVRTLDLLPNADRFLYRFEIPAGAKRSLGGMLFVLGITRQNLFPDLQNLSAAIIDEVEAYGVPEVDSSGAAAGSK